jgi:hypothetical protein
MATETGACAEREKEILSEINLLNKVSKELSELSLSLSDKLSAVMSSTGTPRVAGDKDVGKSCKMAVELFEIRKQFIASKDILEDILSNLEL